MYSKRLVILVSTIVIIIVTFVFLRSCDKKKDVKTTSSTLAPGVVEKLVINPTTHKLTIITPGKEQTLFLPDRPSSIEISKNSKIVVTSRTLGTELKPFLGFQMSNAFRLSAGLDGIYYKKLDLGIGLADQIGMHTPIVFGKLSYNVWDNVQVGLTFDNTSHIGGILTVRL